MFVETVFLSSFASFDRLSVRVAAWYHVRKGGPVSRAKPFIWGKVGSASQVNLPSKEVDRLPSQLWDPHINSSPHFVRESMATCLVRGSSGGQRDNSSPYKQAFKLANGTKYVPWNALCVPFTTHSAFVNRRPLRGPWFAMCLRRQTF